MKKSIPLMTLLFAVALTGSAQNKNHNRLNKIVNSEESGSSSSSSAPPAFPGGDYSLYSYLSQNLNYPKMAVAQKAEGLVTVRFMVDADGSVKNASIPKGKGIGNGCD